MQDPKVNPNALGAPTEGFGQTVTFAFDPRGVTPTLSLPTSQPKGMSVSGVSNGQPRMDPREAYKPVKQDPTAALLLKAAEEVLAPRIKEEQNRAFVQGIHRAMNGEATAEIAKEQPWYARIFGDTPMVEGARAYEASAKVNEVVARETAGIDQIKHLPPDEAAKHFSKLIDGQMTGDPSTDALVAKSMVDQLPGLMKAQAKAHYGYGQRKAMDALSKNMATAGDALQQAGQQYADGTINDADFAARKAAMVSVIMPPDGINEENFAKTLTANLRRHAERGNFHAINAVRESGGFGALTPEQANSVEAAIMSAATKRRDNYAFQFMGQIAELRSDSEALPAGMTPAMIADRYKKMNDAYQKLTGSPVGLFSSDEMANGVKGAFNFLKREEAAAAARAETLASKEATAAAKQLAAAEQALAVDRLIAFGQVNDALRLPGVSKDEVDTAWKQRFASDTKSGMDLLRNSFQKGAYVNPQVRDSFQELLRGSEGRDAPTGDFFQGVALYESLKGGTGAGALADAYFGDYAPKIERFIRMGGTIPDNPNVIQAFDAAMDRSGTMKRDPLPAKEAAKLAKQIDKTSGTFLPEWMGGDVAKRPEALEVLASIAEQGVADWRAVPGITDSEAVARGIGAALATKRAEVIGGFAVNRRDTTDTPTLREVADGGPVAIPKGRHDAYFRDFLMTKGIDGGRAMIYGMGSKNGAGRYAVSIVEDGELPRTVLFNSDEWVRFAGEQALKDTTPAKPTPFAVGPYVDYSVPGLTRPIEGKPSIYAKPAEWAKHRADEERKRKLQP